MSECHGKADASRRVPAIRCVVGPRGAAIDGSEGFVLAEVVLGPEPEAKRGDGHLVLCWPLESLDAEPRREVWLSRDEPEIEWLSDGVLAIAGDVLFGQLVASRQAGSDLVTATRELYSRLFHALDSREKPNLLRAWVAIPRINVRENGLERYRAFCRGRAEAFERHYGVAFEGALPASTAVGARGGLLTLNFLASSRAGRHSENPRQTSAYRYPREHGPRSPSFARCTSLPPELGGAFLVAGTSSIIGHASRHRGDFRLQLRETLRNLDILLVAEARECPTRYGLEPTSLRVYLRRSDDLDEARTLVGAWLPGEDATSYVRADICRAELLVEVESIAEPAWGSAA